MRPFTSRGHGLQPQIVLSSSRTRSMHPVAQTTDDPLDDIATTALLAAFGSDADATAADTSRAAGLLAPSSFLSPGAAARSRLSPGVVLGGRYEILAEIGAGGMGRVYEALDRGLDRCVAVKVLAVSGSASFDPERLFEREARLLAGIQHNNLVAVHEVSRDGDVTYLVMDRVQGRSLNELLRRVRARLPEGGFPREGALLRQALDLPLPEGRNDLLDGSWFSAVARVLLEVARTLQSAHAAHVLHRDLKPANLMLRGDGSPVVLDFGLAAAQGCESGGLTQGLFGSVAYLAPEQVQHGRVGADPRSDVYQLGVTLYEMLTLRRAFPGESPTVIFSKVALGDFVRPRRVDPGVPYELEAICLCAMEPDLERRYATMHDLADDLQRYVDGREIPRAARARWIRHPLRRARWLVRTHRVASLVAAALVVGALGAWSMRPETAPATVHDALVTAYRSSADGSELQLGDEIRGVASGDLLGVVLDTDSELQVYALSVFDDRTAATWVLPLVVEPLEPAVGDDLAFDDWNFTVRVPEGRTFLTCARVDDSQGVTREGLWIFTSPDSQPALARWMRELDDLARSGDEAGVPFDTALERLEFDALRGVSLEGDIEAAAAVATRLRHALEARDAAWPFDDPRRAVFSYPVRQ